jgi:hypothetical protein
LSLLRRIFLSLVLLLPGTAQAYTPPTSTPARPFTYPDDTFSFKNETVWNYVGGEVLPDQRTDGEHGYTRRCFVLTRASMQFWKFARFDPAAAPLSADELAHRIREVCARSVWLPALGAKDRIVIPGYRSLREASTRMPSVFQDNIGLGWPFYFRAGNIVIVSWVSRALEAHLNDEIFHDLQMETPTMIWMYRFPSLKMNHVVVIYSGTRDASGYHYRVYDTNYRDGWKRLDFDPRTRTFTYQPVYYFKGGPVTVRSIYRGLTE